MNISIDLSGDVAVVTGGRGTGQAIAKTLAEAGATVGRMARQILSVSSRMVYVRWASEPTSWLLRRLPA
jgi:NAD(P)-dependent dehydrogenase (short-subunit alcohol dehydrogenase family)